MVETIMNLVESIHESNYCCIQDAEYILSELEAKGMLPPPDGLEAVTTREWP